MSAAVGEGVTKKLVRGERIASRAKSKMSRARGDLNGNHARAKRNRVSGRNAAGVDVVGGAARGVYHESEMLEGSEPDVNSMENAPDEKKETSRSTLKSKSR